MAENWPWESLSQAPTSSTQTSPPQSGSSESSHEEAVAVSAAEIDRPTTLVETLRTCLANAAPSTTSLEPAAAGRDDPLRQQLRTGSGSKTGMKRRSRASRRVPTTVVETTSSDFKETVHRLTGIPAPTPPSTPVRPQPQRAFIRPTVVQPAAARMPPAPRPPQLLNSLLHITEAPPPMHPAYWNQPFESSVVKSEVSVEGIDPDFDTSTPASTMSQMVSAPAGSIQTWWDSAPQPQSQSYLMSPPTTESFNVSGTSGGGPCLQDEFGDWLYPDHSGSDYMR